MTFGESRKPQECCVQNSQPKTEDHKIGKLIYYFKRFSH